MLRTVALIEEHPDLDFGNMPAGGKVGLVFDEHAPGIGIACEVPSIPIGAVIKLSDILHRRPFGCVFVAAFLSHLFFGKHRRVRTVSERCKIEFGAPNLRSRQFFGTSKPRMSFGL